MKKKHFLFLFTLISMIGTKSWALDSRDGIYQIGSAEDLVAFAELVNNGENGANAVLTADIDMEGIPFAPIGKGPVYNRAAGTSDIKNPGYAGTFDGRGHTVSNFKIVAATDESVEAVGFFGILTGTVKNVGIVNASYDDPKGCRAGGIVGTVVASSSSVGLVENCFVVGSSILTKGAVCGAVAGSVYGGVVKNCWAMGNELSGAGTRFGGVAGDTRSDGKWFGTVENCYTDHVRITSSQAGTTTGGEGSVSAERFKSGEVCYLLNGDQSKIVWYQTLGEDSYPVLDSTRSIVVKNEDDSYGNETGIDMPTTDNRPHPTEGIYDLSGRKVARDRMSKGIYIINGKKVVIR